MINQTLKEYVILLGKSMPRQLLLPQANQTSDAVFTYYYNQLRQVYQYPDLRTNVCQNFRELGNIIIFCLQLEKSLQDLFI
ncbi:unnamed protein product [Protopolystoma xenopodis]|uniref:Uncharacterized protein n=1 Tax=Protopolystoma xenopodis TaxID=117903 RepID=A0A3S5CPG4_9PLAT|nr:unnamed protein product [Protopolystoma xenopodis]